LDSVSRVVLMAFQVVAAVEAAANADADYQTLT